MWLAAALGLALFLQAPDYAAEGMKALEERRYEDAAGLFAKAIAADPKDYGAHFHLALAQSLLGRDAEAIQGYRKVLELKPGLYEAELNLGMVLLRQKQAQEAAGHLGAAAEKKPSEFRPRLYLAQAQFESGDFAGAERNYQAAAELDPKSAAAQLGLAKSKARQNRSRDAEPHFRKAAELDPGFADALLELASLYEKEGRKPEAIAIYQQFPENVAARERAGELLLEADRAAEAIPHLEWAVGKSPTTANRIALALAYKKNNQAEKQIALLRQTLDSEPDSLEVRMFYGRALRDRKDYAAAAREFLHAARAKPDSVEAWNELAGMLISLEDYTQAIAVLDRIRTLGGETEGHLYLRALVLDRVHDYKGALDSYQTFLAMSQGKHPDEEFKARQRARIIQKEIQKR
jgi:tetratricopeptide (TPR) repeat protein